MRYTIMYDRKKCMGAAECEKLDSRMWAIADDGKADLAASRKEADGSYSLALDNNDLEKTRRIAKSCPAGCIRVKVD